MYKKTYQPSTTLMSSPVGHEIEAVLCSHTIDCSSYADANFTPPFKTSASEAANDAAFVNFEFVFCFVIIVTSFWNSNFNVKRVIYYIYITEDVCLLPVVFCLTTNALSVSRVFFCACVHEQLVLTVCHRMYL